MTATGSTIKPPPRRRHSRTIGRGRRRRTRRTAGAPGRGTVCALAARAGALRRASSTPRRRSRARAPPAPRGPSLEPIPAADVAAEPGDLAGAAARAADAFGSGDPLDALGVEDAAEAAAERAGARVLAGAA